MAHGPRCLRWLCFSVVVVAAMMDAQPDTGHLTASAIGSKTDPYNSFLLIPRIPNMGPIREGRGVEAHVGAGVIRVLAFETIEGETR